MKWYTHIICSLTLSPFIFGVNPLAIAAVGFASILPDLLEMRLRESGLPIPHRNPFTHNLITPMLFVAPAMYIPQLWMLAFGYFHHLLLDALTVTGVWFFSYKLRGPFKSYDPGQNVFVVVLHALLAYLIGALRPI